MEIWQANAAGRYPHKRDNHNAPTDPNFTGCGRTMTDSEGRYRFVTIRPGEYPWRNHYNAWRPAHIHFSLFGPAFVTRLVTQMYFPGDPLLEYDPMYTSIPDERARRRLVSHVRLGDDDSRTGARLPFRHRPSRPRRDADGQLPSRLIRSTTMSLQTTASQTVGPYLHIGLTWLVTDNLVGPGVSGEKITIEGRVLDGDGKPVSDALVEIWQANAHGKYAHPDDRAGQAARGRLQGIRPRSHRRARAASSSPRSSRGASRRRPADLQAPHINVTIFMRGLLKQLHTRIYFPADPANADDAVLQSVPQTRRGTLIAKPVAGRPGALEWNVIVQGDGETVFFAC